MTQEGVGKEVGQIAPDFTLPYSRTESWTVSQQKGRKVVIAFYVLDFTGG